MMDLKFIKYFLIFCLHEFALSAQPMDSLNGIKVKYYGKESFTIIGTAFPDLPRENVFDRLPLVYKENISEEVWILSKNSSGMSVRFLTNSSVIKIKWEIKFNNNMYHMAATGSKGVDLYCKQNEYWQYINTGIPKEKKNTFLMAENMLPQLREYCLNLPLYNAIEYLEIGIDSTAEMIRPVRQNERPFVFYGTSITQGACASRPGMAYTNIISRKLNRECINLGFSGHGTMDIEMAKIISDIDAAYYIIDCIPNMSTEEVREQIVPFINTVRNKRKNTPLIFIEGISFTPSLFVDSIGKQTLKNEVMKIEFNKAVNSGIKYLYYIKNDELLGTDHEATVDGVHFTDLGCMRFADAVIENLKNIPE